MSLFDIFRRKPKHIPVKHNYTRMHWGHAIQGLTDNWSTKKQMKVTGHGPIGGLFCPRIKKGDFILISSTEGPVMRLAVKKVEYFRDPSDMFAATLKFDGLEGA
ncbi:hypothetical protein ACKWMY_17600 [Serratia sp. J2]|uniref:hypothetical protein n=1 Tax=Serratia sp. J2 TaxID=3386551 RepID=UPI0039170E7A